MDIAEVEYRALALVFSEMIWLQSLLKELYLTLPHTTVLFL